jgi:5'-nucleotidase
VFFVRNFDKPVVLLDQDGPLADFDAAIDEILTSLGLDPVTLHRTTWHTSEDIERCYGFKAARAVQEAVHADGFFRTLPVKAGSVTAVRALEQAGCEVFVCTAPSLRNSSCASDKMLWIAEHFPSLRRKVVVSKDKTLVRGHVLIDDKPEVSGALTPVWQHVLFETPGNAHVAADVSLSSWGEVEWLVDHVFALQTPS